MELYKKYVKTKMKDAICNSSDIVEFVLAQEAAKEFIKANGAERMIDEDYEPETVENPRPQLRADFEELREADAELAAEVMRSYRADLVTYMTIEKANREAINDHYRKRGIVSKAFQNYFGYTVTSRVKDLLEQNQYAEAWKKLEEEFFKDKAKRRAEVNQMIYNLTFDRDMEVYGFFALFETLYLVKEKLSNEGIDECDKIMAMTTAIKKGHRGFKFAIETIENDQKDYEEAKRLIINRFNSMKLDRELGLHKTSNTKGYSRPKEAYQMERKSPPFLARKENQQSSKLRCWDCGEAGHKRNDPECRNKKGKVGPSKEANQASSRQSGPRSVHDKWKKREEELYKEIEERVKRDLLNKQHDLKRETHLAAVSKMHELDQEEEEEHEDLSEYWKSCYMITRDSKTNRESNDDTKKNRLPLQFVSCVSKDLEERIQAALREKRKAKEVCVSDDNEDTIVKDSPPNPTPREPPHVSSNKDTTSDKQSIKRGQEEPIIRASQRLKEKKARAEAHVSIAQVYRSNLPVTNEIFDTGATDHMYYDVAKLTNVGPPSKADGGSICLGGNHNLQLQVEGVGRYEFLKDVLYVPGLKKNLISGPKLMSAGYIQIYLGKKALVFDPAENLQLVMSGTLCKSGLIHRDEKIDGPTYEEVIEIVKRLSEPVPQFNDIEGKSISPSEELKGSATNRLKIAREMVKNEWTILHNRLGHANRQKLYNLVKHKVAIGINCKLEELNKSALGTCTACWLGKFRKLPAPKSISAMPTKKMEIIRSDIKGPFQTKSLHGNRYFQLHQDATTTYLWINFHKTKDTAANALIELQQRAATPINATIKKIQSDSDTIYKSARLTKWANQNGIELQYTAPYRHEGSIEANMKAILDMMRTVMIDGAIPNKYWETVAEACVMITNCLPNNRYPQSCPFKELTGKRPDISTFVPLGYPAVCKVYDEEGRSSSEPKGMRCKVIGYATNTPKSYLVLTETGKVLVRRDVLVDENYTITRQQSELKTKNILEIDEDKGEENTSAVDDVYLQSHYKSDDKPLEIRRSQRTPKPIQKMSLTTESINLRLPPTPSNIHEAVKETNPYKYEWVKAINKEMEEILTRGIIEDEDEEVKHQKPFKSKFAFRTTWKQDLDQKMQKMKEELARGNYSDQSKLSDLIEQLVKFKARLCTKGFTAIKGLHYDQTNSPTISYRALLIVITLAAVKDWIIAKADIGNAYLEAERPIPLRMTLPTDWTGGEVMNVKLAGNLYGTKDGGLLWYKEINDTMKECGYSPLASDPCIYTLHNDTKITAVVCIFVDDIFITAENIKIARQLKANFEAKYKKLTYEEEPSSFLNLSLERDREHRVIYIGQQETIDKYLLDAPIGDKQITVPIRPSINFIDTESNTDTKPIWKDIGKIRYLADRTRPDLAFATSKLGTKAALAPKSYQTAVDELWTYIHSTRDKKLKLGGTDQIEVFAYSDASDLEPAPQLGYAIFPMKNSGAIAWRSTKDKTVSTSSTDAEIKALTELIKDLLWIDLLMEELGTPLKKPITIYQDNANVITLAETFSINGKTRYLAKRIQFIREHIQNGFIVLIKVKSNEMVADILTAAREERDFTHLLNILMGIY